MIEQLLLMDLLLHQLMGGRLGLRSVSARCRTGSVEIDARGRHLLDVVVVDLVGRRRPVGGWGEARGATLPSGPADGFHGTGSAYHSEKDKEYV